MSASASSELEDEIDRAWERAIQDDGTRSQRSNAMGEAIDKNKALFDEALRQQREILTLQQEAARKTAEDSQKAMKATLDLVQQMTDRSLHVYSAKLEAKMKALERMGLADLSLEVDKEV